MHKLIVLAAIHLNKVFRLNPLDPSFKSSTYLRTCAPYALRFKARIRLDLEPKSVF